MTIYKVIYSYDTGIEEFIDETLFATKELAESFVKENDYEAEFTQIIASQVWEEVPKT